MPLNIAGYQDSGNSYASQFFVQCEHFFQAQG